MSRLLDGATRTPCERVCVVVVDGTRRFVGLNGFLLAGAEVVRTHARQPHLVGTTIQQSMCGAPRSSRWHPPEQPEQFVREQGTRQIGLVAVARGLRSGLTR
ncbi:hypothetical protein GCM10009843_27930 [Nocardioides bigeumensis]|uniref:Uncharacterized protein n=1 Tax=Nocardioides bigeumensis TaxID=433657 RepID=A0ABP5K9L9_9ACTN